jgi:hypothetical protein
MVTHKLLFFVIAVISFSASTQAQQPNAPKTNSQVIVSPKGVNKSESNAEALSPDRARRQLISFFNLFRDYSVTFDTLSTSTSTAAFSMEAVPEETSEKTEKSFANYLDKMGGILARRMEGLPKDDRRFSEEQRLKKALTMLKSASCLAYKSNGYFALTKDQEGNEIMAYPLDSLRKKTRYGLVDNYKEGFARIRKDQVYGFLNFCGEEVIPCQFEHAENFNSGKAIVKRVDWFFLDQNGEESEPLENIVSAKAIGNGAYLARFANTKQALIDNEYDKAKMPKSSYYDVIDVFNRADVFKVRNGKKFGIITLNGKEKLEPIYDEIEATAIPGIYRVMINGRYGLADSNFVIRYKPEFISLTNFNESGVAKAETANGFILIQQSNFKVSRMYEYIGEFNEFGVAPMRDMSSKLYGLIDANLTVIVQPKYFSIGNFNELGLAAACLSATKCGFIKWDGSEQIKANYESVGNFSSFGLAVATVVVQDCKYSKDGRCVANIIIDSHGNTVVPITDESLSQKWRFTLTDTVFSENYMVIDARKEGESGVTWHLLIDQRSNRLITPAPYQSIAPLDHLGIFRVKRDNLWGMIDTSGKVLTKCIYTELRRSTDNYYPAMNDKNKWGFINTKGRAMIPFEYEDVKVFNNGFAPAMKTKGKWGLISRFNAKVVPCVFKAVNLKENGKYEVVDTDGKVYIVNENGECETNCPAFEKIRAEANKTPEGSR